MRILRTKDQVVLTASAAEAGGLGRILHTLIDLYRIPPDELDAKASDVWYSTRGCATAKMSAEETREWIHHLQEFRGARLQVLERCEAHLRTMRPDRVARLSLSLAEASELITALNDHRLAQAAQHDIGEAEMSWALEKWLRLRPEQHQALAEIHLLAQMIEQLVRSVAPEAADWPNATEWRPGQSPEEG